MALDTFFYTYSRSYGPVEQHYYKGLGKPSASLQRYCTDVPGTPFTRLLPRKRKFYFITCCQPFWRSMLYFFFTQSILKKMGLFILSVGNNYLLWPDLCGNPLSARHHWRRRSRLFHRYINCVFFQQAYWHATTAQRKKKSGISLTHSLLIIS